MQNSELARACEQILAENVADVATELRLVNVIDLIGYVQGERIANLEDLVNSSAELYFKPDALRYAWSADLEVLWDACPAVSLNMEFCWRGATAFFTLCLSSAQAAVDIKHIDFATPCDQPQERLRHFVDAVLDARLAPPRRAVAGVIFKSAQP